MKKDYEAFVKELRQGILTATGMEDSRVYFEGQGGKYNTAGDRLFVEFAVYEEGKEVCGVYTEDLYDRYQDDTSIEEIVHQVLEELEKAKRYGYFEKARNLTDYERAKNSLFVRLLNYNRNEKELQNAVYRTLGDMALVLYFKVSEEDDRITSFKIREEIVDRWGKDEEEIFKDALLNTYFISPPRIYRWEILLFEQDYAGENFMNLMSGFQINRDPVGNCLSTTKRTNGAVAVFLPGVAERLGQLFGGGFYLVFTSIHEVMVHDERNVRPQELANVLADTIREATPQEDYLTSNIYHYDRENGEFSCVKIG